MGKGQAFLADDKTARGVIKHLRIVISDAAVFEDDGEAKYLVVSVTTWHEGAIQNLELRA